MLYNRDLSWLGFNERVLDEAGNPAVPLFERLKFLAIFSSNLDEFFRVRYPSVLALSGLNKKLRDKIFSDENNVAEQAQTIIGAQLTKFGFILNKQLLPALKENNIHFYYGEELKAEHKAETREIMLSEILSFMQPVHLAPNAGKSFIPENAELYFIVTLDNEDGTLSNYSLNIPSKKLKRFYTLESIGDVQYVVFIDDIIRENLSLIFAGRKVFSAYSIKLNRDAELNLEDDFSAKLLEKVEKKLAERDHGAPSRLLFEMGMPKSLQLFLATTFNVELSEMFEGGRYHNLSDLFGFPIKNKDLSYPSVKTHLYPASAANGEIFKAIDEKDLLLHFPYDSYSPVLMFFNQAAVDPEVTDINITLYRVAKESHIVNALISAAKNGKKVTAFVELKARFDEANNIRWSRVMKDAGVRLIYSDVAIKVHSKIGLVQKVSDGRRKLYSIVSTGNFNESTASVYTDHALFTADRKIGNDLRRLFGMLGRRDMSKLGHLQFDSLLVSQFNLIAGFEELVRNEMEKAAAGEPAYIRIKVNNLEDPWIINLLYEASQAGVRIALIVRTICCLIPGVEGMSENITVKRIVGRYLEHSRIFIFGTNENAKVMMGSSDLMIRNIRRRIEVLVKVQEENVRQQLIAYFNLQWNNNLTTVTLSNNMEQHKVEGAEAQQDAQQAVMEYITQLHA